jgi:hypothetical protein
MPDAVVTVIVGFVLTTVVGGLLGYFFQRRSWSHQYRIEADARQRDRAVELFDEMSRLLDRRLYRMRRLYWALVNDGDRTPSETSRDRMADYVAVLYDWNDNINRNLALLQRYFGQGMRDRLDNEVGVLQRELGGELESVFYGRSRLADAGNSIEERFTRLAGLIYHFNVDMITSIQHGDLGTRRSAA